MKIIFILLGVISMSMLPSKKDMALVKDNLYFDKREVSNLDWKSFEKAMAEQNETTEGFKGVGIWGIPSMDKAYDSHAAYESYPVIGVTQKGAQAYCQWRNQNSTVDGTFRLPTTAEFQYAIQAGESNEKWEKAKAKAEKRYGKDAAFYNFNVEATNKHLTAPTNSYLPNGQGIYNLKGNVSEMVQEENIAIGGSWNDPYQIGWDSPKSYEGPQAWIGFRCVCQLN